MICCKRKPIDKTGKDVSKSDDKVPANDTVATKYLMKRINDLYKEPNKTLINWRIQDSKISQALLDYCSNDQNGLDGDDMDESRRKKLLMEETLVLCDRVNRNMADQEHEVSFFPGQETKLYCKTECGEDEYVSIVFCGKEAQTPRVLSELLVNRLSEVCLQVYTVSRSTYKPKNQNIKHFQCKNLTDEGKDGVEGFANVIRKCVDEYFPIDGTSQTNNKKKKLLIYFTMGFYKRDKALQDNLISAKNLSKALVDVFSNRTNGSHNEENAINWKVIVTGTDATLPSTNTDRVIKWKDVGKTTPYELTVPTYKIGMYNYVYAMSKLGQFFAVADAISSICKSSEDNYGQVHETLSRKLDKITEHVNAAGNDSLYHKEGNNIISMSELDTISSTWTNFYRELPVISEHLAIVTDLTIMYTPLHIVPWVEEAITKRHDKDEFKGSMKSRIVSHVLWRFRNAISIELGVLYHLKHVW